MDEAKLIEKLRLLEALFVGGATEGERDAAGRARERIIERLREVERSDPPIEYRFSPSSSYSRRLLVTLLRRYGIRPYRLKGQRHSTVMARVPQRFVDETLWPQFERYAEMLDAHLSEVTDRVVAQVMQADVEEAEVVEQPRQLPLEAVTPTPPATASTPPAVAPSRSGNPMPGAGRDAGPASSAKVSRNAPCPCSSGRKYKRCCGRTGP